MKVSYICQQDHSSEDDDQVEAKTPPIDYDDDDIDGDEDMSAYLSDEEEEWKNLPPVQAAMSCEPENVVAPKLVYDNPESALADLVKRKEGRHDFVDQYMLDPFIRNPEVGPWFRRRVLMALAAPHFEWDIGDDFNQPTHEVEPETFCAKLPLMVHQMELDPVAYLRTLRLGFELFPTSEASPEFESTEFLRWVMLTYTTVLCKNIDNSIMSFSRDTIFQYDELSRYLEHESVGDYERIPESHYAWVGTTITHVYMTVWRNISRMRWHKGVLGHADPKCIIETLTTCDFKLMGPVKMLVFKIFAPFLTKAQVDAGKLAGLIRKLRDGQCSGDCIKICMETLLPKVSKSKCRSCSDALLGWLDHESGYDIDVLLGKLPWLKPETLQSLVYGHRFRGIIMDRVADSAAQRRDLSNFWESVEYTLTQQLRDAMDDCSALHKILFKNYDLLEHLKEPLSSKYQYQGLKIVEWFDTMNLTVINNGWLHASYYSDSGSCMTLSRSRSSVNNSGLRRTLEEALHKARGATNKLAWMKIGPTVCDSCRAVEVHSTTKPQPVCLTAKQLKTAVKHVLKKQNDEATATAMLRNYAYLAKTGLAEAATDQEILGIVKAGLTNEIRFNILNALLPGYLENSSEVIRTGWFVDSLQPQRLIGQKVITIEIGSTGDFIMQVLPNPARYASPEEALRRMGVVSAVKIDVPQLPETGGAKVPGAVDAAAAAVPERRECKVCLEREITTVFIDCQHAVCCDYCAETSCNAGCPVCRGPSAYLKMNYC